MDLSASDWAHVNERAEHFSGREWVFERIRSFLASDARMVVIVAPPGTGKTAIAARLAQASAGRLPDEVSPPIPPGTLAAAAFCQVGRVSLLGVAQDLADQLASAVDGFAIEQRSAVATQVTVGGVDVQVAGDVTGTVAGVRIDLAALGPERAFADGLALPLRRLGDTPGFRHPVLLVDSLDEAYASPIAQKLPGLLAGLSGARLILTTRDDPRVLAAIGLEAAVAAGRAVRIHLIDDVPPATDDVAGYAAGRLRGQGPDDSVAVLAARIGAAASGNFLYAYHVVAGLRASSALEGLDVPGARSLSLPAGGLPGVYRDFLGRELGGDEERWSREVRPILAPIAVALGDGLDTTQLAAIGGALAARAVPRSAVRDVTRRAGQFLKGRQPDGPFGVYHRSFADFLLDADVNPDWPVDASETNAAIVDALTPRGSDGQAHWSAADSYARANLAEHAAASGRLDALLADPGFLVVADVDRLVPLLRGATSTEAREGAGVVQLASSDLRGAPAEERGSYLELAARMRGADAIAARISVILPDRPWRVPAARWSAPGTHVRLTGHRGRVGSVAVGRLGGRPVAISGGEDGTVRVWDLRDLVPSGEPLQGHRGAVWTVAAGEVDGRPVAVSGGWDATVRVWDLERGTQSGDPLEGHEDYVRSVATGVVDHRALVASAGADGIRVWDPRMPAPLGDPLPSPKGAVNEVALATTQNGTVVACASADGAVRVWTVDQLGTFSKLGEPLFDDTGWPVPVGCVAAGELDGRPVIVSGSHGGSLRAWDLGTMAPLGDPVEAHEWGVLSVATGMMGERAVVASAGRDGIRVWDLRTMAPLGDPLVGHEGIVSSVAITAVDGSPILVSGGADGTVRVWDLGRLAPPGATPADRPGRLDAVATGLVGDRPVVVTVGETGIRTWDLEALAPLGGPSGGDSSVTRVLAVGAVDERLVAVAGGGFDATPQVWDVGTLELRGPLPGHAADVRAIAAGSIDGRPIAITGDSAGEIRLWDLRALTQVGDPIAAHERAVLAIGICTVDDQTVVVSGGDDEEIRVWDVGSPASAGAPLGGRAGRIASLAVGLADGRPVAVRGGYEGAVRVWDLRTLDLLEKPLRGHAGTVTCVAIDELHDRPVIVSAGNDGTLRAWDLGSWSQVWQISVPILTSLAVVRPDRIVATASSGLMVIRVVRLPAPPVGSSTRHVAE